MVVAVALSLWHFWVGFIVFIIGIIYLFAFTNDWGVPDDFDARDGTLLSHVLVALIAMIVIGFSGFLFAAIVAFLVSIYLVIMSVRLIPSASNREKDKYKDEDKI